MWGLPTGQSRRGHLRGSSGKKTCQKQNKKMKNQLWLGRKYDSGLWKTKREEEEKE
jgi:hypothetical protein